MHALKHHSSAMGLTTRSRAQWNSDMLGSNTTGGGVTLWCKGPRKSSSVSAAALAMASRRFRPCTCTPSSCSRSGMPCKCPSDDRSPGKSADTDDPGVLLWPPAAVAVHWPCFVACTNTQHVTAEANPVTKVLINWLVWSCHRLQKGSGAQAAAALPMFDPPPPESCW